MHLLRPDERTLRARQDYEQARGTAHKRLLQAARRELRQRIATHEETVGDAQKARAALLAQQQQQLKTALARHLVTSRLTEVPGIGAQRQQQIINAVFRDSLYDLRYADRVPGIGSQTQQALNQWVQTYMRREAELLKGAFPGKAQVLAYFSQRLDDLDKQIAAAQAQLTLLNGQLRQVDETLAWLEPIKEPTFQQALRQPQKKHPRLDQYTQGVFAEWEPIPDWFETILQYAPLHAAAEAPGRSGAAQMRVKVTDNQRSTGSRPAAATGAERVPSEKLSHTQASLRSSQRPSFYDQLTANSRALLILGFVALGFLCICCLSFALLAQLDLTPTPQPIVHTRTAMPTRTATASVTPTHTPTPRPTTTTTATPTRTPRPSPTQTTAPSATATPLPEVRVIVSAANVRQGPDVTQPIVAVVRADTRLRVLGQDATGSWIEVQLTDGAVGWIGSSVVEAVDPAAEDDDT